MPHNLSFIFYKMLSFS